MRNAKLLAAVYVGVLVISAVAVNLTRSDGPVPTLEVDLAAALVPFEACDDAVAYFTETAAEQAAAQRDLYARIPDDDLAADGAAEESAGLAPAPTAPDAGGAQRAGEDFSTTNVQEAGVDEPDLVKTDGRRIITVSGGRLQVVDVTGASPTLAASLELPGDWSQDLLLDGDRALVFSSAWSDQPIMEGSLRMPGGSGQTVLTLVDLTDTAAPQVASTLTMDGEYVSARLIGGVARVVLRSHPGGPVMDLPMRMDAPMPDLAPMPGPAPMPDEAPTPGEAPTSRSGEPTIDDWVPHYRLEADEDTTSERLVECEQIHRPVEPAGTGMVTVLSVDLAGQLEPSAAASVVADAQTVYASPDTLYVAFTGWEQDAVTQIHAFDITDPAAAVYRASGAVPGRLLNQWALSEHAGHLRVATTEGDTWAGPAVDPPLPVEPGPASDAPAIAPPPNPSHSAVTVLAVQGDELVQVGRVEGLGPTERIYSVRFMGDVGYVVTFRETDPLYTLDLSEPADPRVLGELKILGYSAYLHPLGDGLLLGVGQDATEQGRLLGTQLSLFDVSDLANPTRTHQTTIADGRSGVEYDHRAFLHWPATGTIVLPLEIYPSDRPVVTEDDMFAGAVAYTVDAAAGFAEVGRVSHAAHLDEQWMGAIRRSLVVGDTLYTLSEAGLQAVDLTTLDERGWVAFPSPAVR